MALPKLTVIENELERRRRIMESVKRIPVPEPTIVAALCLVAGLATVAIAVAMVYLPAGLFVAGVELAAGAIAYTRGAKRVEGEQRTRRRRRHR